MLFTTAASGELGGLIGDHVSWDIADGEVAAPYLVAQTVSGNGDTTHDGDRSLTFPLVQFTAWAKTKVGAIAIMSAFRREIEGRELPGASKVSLTYGGEMSTRDPDTKLFGETRDYRISALSN